MIETRTHEAKSREVDSLVFSTQEDYSMSKDTKHESTSGSRLEYSRRYDGLATCEEFIHYAKKDEHRSNSQQGNSLRGAYNL